MISKSVGTNRCKRSLVELVVGHNILIFKAIFCIITLSFLAACGGGGGGGSSAPAEPPPPPPPPPPPATPQALTDPIGATIEIGSITLATEKFVRAPATEDPVGGSGSNSAYARIQYLQSVPDGSNRMFFNDTRGVLYVTDQDGAEPQVFLDLREEDVAFYPHRFPNESGFMGFAFHPQFGESGAPGYGKLYTSFSTEAASGVADFIEEGSSVQESVVYEWSVTDHTLNVFEGTYRELLRVGQFAPNHNIGNLAFNPNAESESADFGNLYISLGDGGSAHDPRNHGQNQESPLGALLRIDPLGGTSGESEYGIPDDNPFVESSTVIHELWAYGLRHPQHYSWDSDGRMFLLDIGQDQIEEVNLGQAGGNYGWRLREGTFATGHGVTTNDSLGSVYDRPTDESTYIYPVAQYDHDEGFAIGSGFVYRGSQIPDLVGKYVFTELVRGRLFYIDTDNLTAGEPTTIYEIQLEVDGTEESLVDLAGHTNSNTRHLPYDRRVDLRVSVDQAGEMYLLSKGDGWIRRIQSVSD